MFARRHRQSGRPNDRRTVRRNGSIYSRENEIAFRRVRPFGVERTTAARNPDDNGGIAAGGRRRRR
jgi:hypothetical protein